MADEVPSVRYEAIILIEPALITREVYNANLAEREGALKEMNKAISKRRDTWNSKEEARAYFEERFPWMMWDLRVRDLFVVRMHCLMRVATSHLTFLLSPALWSAAGVHTRRQREAGREGHARMQLRPRALRILPGRGILHRRRPHPVARPRRPRPLHPRRAGRPHVCAFFRTAPAAHANHSARDATPPQPGVHPAVRDGRAHARFCAEGPGRRPLCMSPLPLFLLVLIRGRRGVTGAAGEPRGARTGDCAGAHWPAGGPRTCTPVGSARSHACGSASQLC